uniref:Uncharacterized protein n=1 Tax=Oryza meridionalis TaxID=40149 RepID=A0A0E0CK34_9ORYZ
MQARTSGCRQRVGVGRSAHPHLSFVSLAHPIAPRRSSPRLHRRRRPSSSPTSRSLTLTDFSTAAVSVSTSRARTGGLEHVATRHRIQQIEARRRTLLPYPIEGGVKEVAGGFGDCPSLRHRIQPRRPPDSSSLVTDSPSWLLLSPSFISQNTNGSGGHELDAARSGSLGLMATGSYCSDSSEQQRTHDGEWQVEASAERQA